MATTTTTATDRGRTWSNGFVPRWGEPATTMLLACCCCWLFTTETSSKTVVFLHSQWEGRGNKLPQHVFCKERGAPHWITHAGGHFIDFQSVIKPYSGPWFHVTSPPIFPFTDEGEGYFPRKLRLVSNRNSLDFLIPSPPPPQKKYIYDIWKPCFFYVPLIIRRISPVPSKPFTEGPFLTSRHLRTQKLL